MTAYERRAWLVGLAVLVVWAIVLVWILYGAQ